MRRNPYIGWLIWTCAFILAIPSIIWLSIWSSVGAIDPWRSR